MRDFIDDLKYMCSSAYTNSRGFYILCAVTLIAMIIILPISLVLMIISIIKGSFNVLSLILLIVSIVIGGGLIFWLKKS